jgi:ribosomal-protein-alanine N-acetyltransferase
MEPDSTWPLYPENLKKTLKALQGFEESPAMSATLKTPRTVIRMAARRDLPTILSWYERNRDHLAPYEPVWPPDFLTVPFWERRIETAQDDFDQGRSARFFIFDRARPRQILGSVSLSQIVRGPFQACYLGYALGADAQGQGLMSEALTRVVRYAFDDLGLHRIMANYMPHNRRSGNVLRGLGFVVEGYARDYLQIAGRWEDHVLTSLSNPRWSART